MMVVTNVDRISLCFICSLLTPVRNAWWFFKISALPPLLPTHHGKSSRASAFLIFPRSLVLLPPIEAPIHSEFLCFMVCSTHQTILCGLVFYTTFPMYDVFLPLPINSPGWSISNIDFLSHTMLIEVQTFKTELDRSWELNLSSQQLRKGGHAVRVVWWISHLADEHSEK